jgi:hypothetical protein
MAAFCSLCLALLCFLTLNCFYLLFFAHLAWVVAWLSCLPCLIWWYIVHHMNDVPRAVV